MGNASCYICSFSVIGYFMITAPIVKTKKNCQNNSIQNVFNFPSQVNESNHFVWCFPLTIADYNYKYVDKGNLKRKGRRDFDIIILKDLAVLLDNSEPVENSGFLIINTEHKSLKDREVNHLK